MHVTFFNIIIFHVCVHVFVLDALSIYQRGVFFLGFVNLKMWLQDLMV